MNDKFDELAKGLAQSVTRRGALKKFGVGLAGVVLASLGLASKAQAGPKPISCQEAKKICLTNCVGLSGAAERDCKNYCHHLC